jgi:hypothetical protein
MHFITLLISKLPPTLILILVLFASNGFGQEKDFRYYDSVSYKQYTDKDWKLLINTGKEAQEKGFEYNYLNMRMGIAYYERRNYRSSIGHFGKSLIYSSDDPVAAEYLYYAYLKSGRGNDAALLAGKYKGKFSMVPGADTGILNYAYVEGGYTPDLLPHLNPAELMGNDSVYGEEDAFRSQSYFHVGIQLQPHPALRIYLAGSTLGINKKRHFTYSLYDATYSNRLITDTIFLYSFRQNEFYAAASYTPLPGITITPAFHFMNGNPTLTNCSYADYTYSFSKQENPYNHYVLSLSLAKEAGKFTLGLAATFARLTSTGRQLQSAGSITWYPFGNLDLYATTTLTGFKYGNDKRLIFDQAIGGKIIPKIWLEALITLGDLSYFNEKNAFVVYNLPEHIVFRSGANLVYTVNQHLDLSLMYRFYKREYDFYNYYYDAETSGYIQQVNKLQYNNQSFFGGMKWKF